MKISINKNAIIQAVNDVIKAVSSKPSLPILNGIKIVADQHITLSSSDSNMSIERIIPLEEKGSELAQILEKGSIVLNAKLLSELIRKMPKDDIDLEVKENLQTVVTSGDSKVSLNGLSAAEFPKLPEIEGEKITFTAEQFKQLVNQTTFAVSTSESRPILTGVNWVIKDNCLTATATDSHRLSIKALEVKGASQSMVVPAKALNDLNKILDGTDETISLTFSTNQALFEVGNLKFYTRLLEGNYPDTSRLIPTEFKTTVKLNVKEFMEAIDRCNLVAKEGKNHVVVLETKEDYFLLSSDSPENGMVEEKIKATISGEQTKIAFSAKFARNALQAFSAKEVEVSFVSNMRPFIIKAENDPSLMQLVLPVRTA